LAGRSRDPFYPSEVDRANFIKTVEAGLPVETAAAAVGWTKSELASLRAGDKEINRQISKHAARAEIKLFTKMMESGQADWRCVQSALERMHPEKYARPEIQVQLAASKIDANDICEAMKEWLTIAEQRHSGITIDEARGESIPVTIEIGEPREDDEK